jgi:hypothetical protein
VASVIVAVVTFVLAAILVMSGIKTLKNISFIPHETIDTLGRDARVLKESLKK